MIELDPEAVRELKVSFEIVGQIYSIIRCKQHQERILAGRHRLKAGGDKFYDYDVDKLAKTIRFSHDMTERLVRIHTNTQRQVSMSETQEELLGLAEQCAKEGTPLEGCAAKVAEMVRHQYSQSYVYELLPEKYKRKAWADATKAGLERAKETFHSVEGGKEESPLSGGSKPPTSLLEVKGRGQSPSLRDNNPSQLTPSHVKLFGLIKHIKGTNFLNEEPHARENPTDADEYTNELNADGSAKSYQTDLVDYGFKLVVEAIGEGSSSDKPKRDSHFEKEGYEVLKFYNEEIEKAPRLVQMCTELQVEVLRLRRQLGASK